MSKPFFSIVIPTKDRPELLRDAISSVLLQSFEDYELIVSDNFSDSRTRSVVGEFQNNPRLQYIRPEKELNIPDHWEFATRETRGSYTLVLTDRAFLIQGALRDICDTIMKSEDAPVVFWKYGYFDEINKKLQGERTEAGVEILNPLDLFRNFSRTLDAHYLPRPHVGCYRYDIAQKIRRNVGRLYMPYGPDYTSSLSFLAYADRVMHIPRPLVFFQGAALSSGTKAQSTIIPYLNSLHLSDPYQFVPIKAPINGNLIFNDLVKAQNLAEGNLNNIDIDWVFYFGACYQELKERTILWKANEKEQAELWNAWAEALRSFDAQFQKAVRKETKRRWLKILKSYIRKTFVGSFLMKVKRIFLGKPTRFYSDALEAGGFEA